ncbi:MAG: bifunctional UDP-N-acetylglucosamine diphosphorylase/glucosamine-1-phosphate N-acetyltransferase GlmU [bacterium]|nr:bifunctional UDP-N-acetylglucosamine diphosphorylase/glucosamine-1-phosphate N-acetyltransferase GlmU [bacterium]
MSGPVTIILAAGKAKRMKSDTVKVLHPVAGRAMVDHVLDAVRNLAPERTIIVVGEQGDRIREALGRGPIYVRQDEPLGTGHAVLQAREAAVASTAPDVLVVYGDIPTVTAEPLHELVSAHRRDRPAATVLSARVHDPRGLGRVIRDQAGGLKAIIEEADASPQERAVDEVNTGIYCFQRDDLFAALSSLTRDNAQGEYYLTDVLAILRGQGKAVAAHRVDDPALVRAVNDRMELAEAERVLRRRALDRLMEQGVTVLDPASTFVDAGVRVGPDTVLYPFTLLEGDTVVGKGCRVGPGARLVDSLAEDGAVVSYSVVEGCRLGKGAQVGPFAHLRQGTILAEGARIGNFAEIKNSSVGEGTKIPHHCYVGDSSIGGGVNIGAGVVVVNYDGRQKHRTVIADRAFVGCNANLVAPVTVHPGGYVAAGSTITRDVPAGALGVGRARQVNVEGWTARKGLGPPPEEREPSKPK